MSLMTRADLMKASLKDPLQTFGQRALARVQVATGQMPPPPATRAASSEVLALANWVASGYPVGVACSGGGAGGAPGGMGGASGTGGPSGTGGAPGGTNAGLPCAVQAVYQAHCMSCHGATPSSNAPMSLVTYADLTKPSLASGSQTFAQRTVVRMQSTASPMPPSPGTPATATEIQTVSSWIAAGYPTGTCGVGGAGGTGGGQADPLAASARCTSARTWTGGNEGNVLMNPGRACVSCHTSGEGEGPRFNIAGTLYPTGHEPNLCNGVNGTTGARVVIVDAAKRTLTLTPNAAGNFTYTGPLTLPYSAKVTYQGRERIMTVTQTSPDCNGCHTQNGANGAPGRITLP